MKKKLLSFIILFALTAALCTLPACVSEKADAETLSVIYDGQKLDFDTEPEIIDGNVMVPMRSIFEAFGAKVKWDENTKTVTAKKKSKTIEMTIGSTEMKKNDETYTAAAAPVISDGRTLVPLRAVSELLGLDVEWNESDRQVIITDGDDASDDSWKNNEGTINLSQMKVSGEGISVTENTVTITKGGDFTIKGTLKNA